MPDRRNSTPSGHPLAAGVRGLHHSMISTANQRAVLMLVATNPGITNAEISRRAGLGAQTVSRFLSDLEKAGLIRRGEVVRGVPGLPPTPLYLVHDSVATIGISVGWRQCDAVLMDMSGQVRRRESIRYDYADADLIAEQAGRLCRRLTEDLTDEERGRIIGAGVSVPAAMWMDLRLLGAPASKADAWRNGDAVARIGATVRLPTFAYEMGTAAAWAEHAAPESPWEGDFVHVHIGDLMVSGIVTGGVRWNGGAGRGTGARIGRVMVAAGRGKPRQLQQVASLLALEHRLRRAGHDRDALRFLDGKGADALVVSAWIDDAAAALAWALVSTAEVAGVRNAVIGGTMPPATIERLCQAVRVRLPELQPDEHERLAVGAARTGPASPAIGASYLPIYDQLFSRTGAE